MASLQRRQPDWLSEISPPEISLHNGSINYIDNLAGSKRSRHNLIPQKKYEQRKSPTAKQSFKTSSAKRQNETKPSKPIDLDDIKWIEERKKKFPKAGDNEVESTEHTSGPRAAQLLNQVSPSQRKKTLFEKLLD